MNMLYHLTFLLLLCICTTSKSADPTGEFCNKNTNISNSRTSVNIDNLLAQLVTTTARSGYSVASVGKVENKVYGLAQCRGDVSTKDCSDCINDAAKEIRARCPNDDARIWYEYCFLRYNTKDFRGEVDTSIGTLYANVENVTNPLEFKKKLGSLIGKISKEANVPSNKGLGKGDSKLSEFVTLYALVQCTRDLSQIGCAQCLAIAVTNFEGFCDNKKGCRVLYSSCYVRYELYPFYFPLESQNSLANDSKTYYVSMISKP